MEKEELNVKISEDQNIPCCDTSPSCLGPSDSTIVSEITNNEPSELELRDSNKLNVDIYVPLNACECVWSQFMNLVFSALTPYMKHIKFETKNLDSEEARKLNLNGNCVVVDSKKKFITSFALKKELPGLLKEKGLL